MTTFDHTQKDAIAALLIGHCVRKVDGDTLELDNGRKLKFVGHQGGCACSAGDYDLTELNGVDNIITTVEFVDDPAGDDIDRDEGEGEGYYRIFVFADNQRVNLATFEGSDGNGHYGTGYHIHLS